MPVTKNDLDTLYKSVTASFLRGLQGKTPPKFEAFTTRMPMTTRTVEAPIAGTVGPLREWKGARIVQTIMRDAYRFSAKKFEKTIGVSVDDIEDDNIGVYMPSIEMLGVQTRLWPDQQVFKLLEQNPVTYDGVAMFSASHPERGGVASNFTAGANPAWYLFDTSMPLKPMIWGERVAPKIVPRQSPDDPHVFQYDEFLWGVRARGTAAPGFWQAAYKSKAPLDAPSFESAVSGMRARVDDQGENLGVGDGLLLVIPASLEWDARRLFGRNMLSGGEENIHNGGVNWTVAQRLTGA